LDDHIKALAKNESSQLQPMKKRDILGVRNKDLYISTISCTYHEGIC